MLKEFKEFAMRGNVVDMAVGIILGGAFGAIVKSLVDNLLAPALGLLLGGVDFANYFVVLKAGTPPGPYPTLADASAAGAVTLGYGVFLNAVVGFLIVAFAVFLLVRALNRLHRKEQPAPAALTTKECPHCASEIPIRATRCPHCTSQIGG